MQYDEDWQFEVIHKCRPPLRWFANLAGSIATSGILHISNMEENGYTGLRYKIRLFLWETFWPIYSKYGSYYQLKNEIDEDL